MLVDTKCGLYKKLRQTNLYSQNHFKSVTEFSEILHSKNGAKV